MVLTCSHWISRVPWYSGYPPSEIDFAYKAITLFRPVFQPCSAIDPSNYAGPKPHRNKFLRFGLFRFRSPLLTKSLIYFLFLRVLRCFSSPGSLLPGFPSTALCVHAVIPSHYQRWVSPFGNLRIEAHLQLPAAYRSLSRPSSALGAKASTLCPY